jgi:hypothetical protein
MIRFAFLIISIFIFGRGYTQRYPPPLKKIEVECKKAIEEFELLSAFKDNYIPLEGVKGSFIKRIEKVLFANDVIIVWDKRQKTILAFKKDGSFISKIVAVSKPGPGEFLYCYDVEVYKNQLYILSFKEIYIYDIELNFIKSISLKKPYSKFIIEDQWVYLYDNNQNQTDREKVASISLDHTDVIHSLLFEERKLGTFHLVNPFNFCNNSGEIMFSYPFSDTIYSLNRDQSYPKYKIDFLGRKYPKGKFDNIADYPGGALRLMNEDLLKKKIAFWPNDFVDNSLGTCFRFKMDGGYYFYFQSCNKLIKIVSRDVLLDGIPIIYQIVGRMQDNIVLSVNPWDLSEKIKSNFKKAGTIIKEDANPILLILSTL